jgi:hypothetical protein
VRRPGGLGVREPLQVKPRSDMAEQRFLGRAEIVGQTISRVYAGRTADFGDVSVSLCFVELTDGTIFELVSDDANEQVHEPRLERSPDGCHSPPEINDDCVGRTVLEVVSCEQWPTIGLHLSGDVLLYCSDDASPRHVKPATSLLGDFYDSSDLRPMS